MIITMILVIYVMTVLVAHAFWRINFRRIWGQAELGSLYRRDWSDVFFLSVLSTIELALWPIFGPYIVARLMTHNGDAKEFGVWLAGTPRQERKAKRIRALEQRNRELEKETGMVHE